MESPLIEAAPLYIELANAKIRDVHKGSNKTESWLSLEMYINVRKCIMQYRIPECLMRMSIMLLSQGS